MSGTLLTQDTNGNFAKVSCVELADGVLAVSTTTETANAFIPILQPNGQIAKIAAVESAGKLTLRTG